jgi:hypothetical protein
MHHIVLYLSVVWELFNQTSLWQVFVSIEVPDDHYKIMAFFLLLSIGIALTKYDMNVLHDKKEPYRRYIQMAIDLISNNLNPDDI